MAYCPEPSVVACRVKFVSTLVAVTATPGTTAPDRSVTVPRMDVVLTCARTATAMSAQRTTARNLNIKPPIPKRYYGYSTLHRLRSGRPGLESGLLERVRVALHFSYGGDNVFHVAPAAEQHGMPEPQSFRAEAVVGRALVALAPAADILFRIHHAEEIGRASCRER